MNPKLKIILQELRAHVPFTAIGTLTGVGIMAFLLWRQVPPHVSGTLFWVFHPLHVFLSALTTVAMYCRHGRRSWGRTIMIGYLGAIGIATLSDCVMPFVGEALLDLPNRGVHLGFVERWWLVNPLALAGIAVGYWWRHTTLSHGGHVLFSTWASLFHMTMAFGAEVSSVVTLLVPLLLFLSVWVPCCTSDIVFPLLFASGPMKGRKDPSSHPNSALIQPSWVPSGSQPWHPEPSPSALGRVPQSRCRANQRVRPHPDGSLTT